MRTWRVTSTGWTPLAVALAAMALAATACLGPGQFDPTGRAPTGSLDVVVDAAGGIRVSGWALDPDTTAPVVVKVGSEGIVHNVTANLSRPDVAAAFPGYGDKHGFDYTFGPLPAGLHGICVWVENQHGIGDDRLLGCDNITVTDGSPVGSLDTVTSLSARTVTVGGWVFDPNTAAASEVVVNIDGNFAARIDANGSRPDVGKAFGRPRSGFSTTVAAEPGRHQVCAATFNVGFGDHRLLGCRDVLVAESTEDRRPVGKLTSVVPGAGGSVAVTGTASDPDGSVGLRVRLDVDAGTLSAQRVTLPVSGGAFYTELAGLAPGLHTICPVGLDVDGGIGVRGDRAFVCGYVFVGDLSVGTGGAASDPTAVAPPPGHPLRLAERDAGVSVTMGDRSTVWLFGDTLERDAAGTAKYFVNNTAAWAAPGAPTVTRDGINGSQPYKFVDAPHSCPTPGFDKPAIWPESAVAVPQGNGTDRVVVYLSKVCLGNGWLEIEARGMALAEFTYDPANPPVDTRISGSVTAADLFGATDPWGRAAVLGADDTTIHVYQCGQFTNPPTDDWGPCEVGRVDFDDRTDPAAYRFWSGGDPADAGNWSADPGTAAPIVSASGADITPPVAAFTLTFDETHGYWLMVYTPFPGFTDRVEVRVADSPVGPFTDPVTVHLPGCNDTTGGTSYRCYAGTAQPQLSQTGLLGVGYFDQAISTGPLRGQYVVVTVPFNVVATPAP